MTTYRPAAVLALVLAAVVPATGVFLLTASSHFVLDDLINLRRAQFEGLSVDYLLSPTSGHFAPGHAFGDWALQEFFPFSFTAARAGLAVGFAISLLLFHRILVTLFRPSPWAVVITLLYGVSVVHVSGLQWWASGLDRVPADIFAFTSILCYLHYARTRAPELLWASIASLGVALLFYVKPIFVPLYLVLIRVLLLRPDRPVRDAMRDTVREWRVWAAYAALVGAYAAVYVSYYPSYQPDRSLDALAEYFGTLWLEVLVPNLFGLFVAQGEPSTAGLVRAVAAQAALVIVVAVSVARRRSAWRAWAFFLAAAAPNAVIIGVSRIDYFGPEAIAYANFFNRELFLLFFVALAAAFLPAREQPAHEAGAGASPRSRAGRSGVRALAVVAVPAYVAGSWAAGSYVSEPDQWVGARARPYFERAEAELAAAFAGTGDAALVDGTVPEEIVLALGAPYNNHSEVFPLFNGDVSFDASRPSLHLVDGSGALQPVSFRPVAGGAVVDLFAEERLGFAGGTLSPAAGGVCLQADEGDAVLGFDLPAPLEGDTYVRLGYLTRTLTSLTFAVEPTPTVDGPRFTYDKPRVVRLPAELPTTRVIAIGAPLVDELSLLLAPGSQICLVEYEIGYLDGAGP